MKCIPIKTCATCPNFDHKGGFGKIAYIPVCRAENKELPYRIGRAEGSTRSIAVASGVIPDWCPLPDLPENPDAK